MNATATLIASWVRTPRLSGSQRWVAAAVLASAVAVMIFPSIGGQDSPGDSTRAVRGNTAASDVAAQRQRWMSLTARDPLAARSQLRTQLEAAQRNHDQHQSWLLLAWLVRTTALLDTESAKALHQQARAEIDLARRAGDALATFELAWVVETQATQTLGQMPNPARLALLQGLATDIGGPLHEGLVLKLRGALASQAGEEDEALALIERAAGLLQGPLDQAELRALMATTGLGNPGVPAAHLAVAHLQEVVQAFPPERFPGQLAPVIQLSQLLSQVGRSLQAVEMAQRALGAAQHAKLKPDASRAQVARGLAYLAAGDHAAALADFNAVDRHALPVNDQLQMLAGRARCLAQLGEEGAREALLAAAALATADPRPGKAELARFHEMAALAWQTLGDTASALQALRAADDIRTDLDAKAQQRLAKARDDAFTQDLQSAEHVQRQPWMLVLAALLIVGIIGMSAAYRRQRLEHRAASDVARSRKELHARLQAQGELRARQLEATCRALRKPAQALALLAQSDGVAASPHEVQARYLGEVRHCSQSLIDTIDALLDMMRLQEGSYVPQPERFDVSHLLKEISQKFEPLALRRGLRWELQADVCGVCSDRQMLRRIVVNLLDHVMSRATGGTVSLRLAATETTQCIEISGTDADGTAYAELAPDAPPANTDLLPPEALGLGPDIARLACQMLGHELSVTRFDTAELLLRVTLPTALAQAPAPMKAQPRTMERSVAIVEDDAFSRITLMNALVDAGLEVQAYATFGELMALSPNDHQGIPGVLITDLHLGDYGDATEALRELRQRPSWRDVPVLMLTGDIRDEVNALASELGVALAYKPISVRRLLERIALLRGPQPLPATRLTALDAA